MYGYLASFLLPSFLQIFLPFSTTNTTMSTGDADDTACEACHSLEADGMLLCEICDRGYHMACLVPPLAEEPKGDDWFCPLCQALRRSDPHLRRHARVRVFWRSYNDWFTGWVIGVRAATADDVRQCTEVKVALGMPLYEVFYGTDDIEWQVLKKSELIPMDEVATELAKSGDTLVGQRIQVWHAQSEAVDEGWYIGTVADVIVERVQRFAAQTLHLVRYDAGDVQWHDLASVRWQHQTTVKAAFGVNAVGRRGTKRPMAEAAVEGEATREAMRERVEEEEAQRKLADFKRAACEMLERALLADLPEAGPATLARPAATGDGEGGDDSLSGEDSLSGHEYGVVVSAAMQRQLEAEEHTARVADLVDVRRSLEGSGGRALADLLRGLTGRRVGREALRDSGVAKLLGRLEKMQREDAIAMAGEAKEEVQRAAADLVAAWTEQIRRKAEAASQLASLPAERPPAAAGPTEDGGDSGRRERGREQGTARARAQAIVGCILGHFETSKERSRKVRALAHNLGAPSNSALRGRVLRGEIAPLELVQMSPEDLAAPAVRGKRKGSSEARQRAVRGVEEEVLEVGVVTREEREARGRAAAVNLIDDSEEEEEEEEALPPAAAPVAVEVNLVDD